MSDFKKRLKKMNKDWKEGKDVPPGAPDGQYAMQLQDCELRESKAGNLYIYREHLIIDGEYEGEVCRDMVSLETEKGPYYVAKFIDQMGYEPPEDITDLPDVLEAIKEEAPTYTAGVKNSGDFVNVRIMELTEGDAGGDEVDEDTDKAIADKVEDGDGAISKGSQVQFEDADVGLVVGEVIDDSNKEGFHIQDADGEVWECPLEDLELVEDDEEEEEAEEEEEEEEASDDETFTALLALAQSAEVEEVDEDDTIETLTEKLSDYEWAADELTPEEVELLEGQGIEVKKPKAKKGANKKKK